MDPAGLLPPKHLRIPGYNYGLPEDSQGTGFDECSPSIVGRESTRELMAGVFLPSCGDVDMADNSSKGESRARHPAAPLAPKRTDLPDIKTQKFPTARPIRFTDRFFLADEDGPVFRSTVTITLNDTRTVKGKMSSRPSWGGAHYAKAAEMAVPNYAM